MIQLYRLNGSMYYLNPLHIEGIESTPDLVITLTNGRKLVVRDKAEEVTAKIIDFYEKVGGLKVVIQVQAKKDED